MHHVQGKHRWLGGKCSNGPMTAPKCGKSYLKFGSPAYNALHQVVFDKKLLRLAHYYVNSRVTYQLESFHNLILKYYPKRIGYRQSYQMRIALAIFDHNHHVGLQPRTRPCGDIVVTRKYSKSSRQYTVVPIRQKKSYEYLPDIVAMILYSTTPGQQKTVQEYQPRLPISGIKPPLTETLQQLQHSRFENGKHHEHRLPSLYKNTPSIASDITPATSSTNSQNLYTSESLASVTSHRSTNDNTDHCTVDYSSQPAMKETRNFYQTITTPIHP